MSDEERDSYRAQRDSLLVRQTELCTIIDGLKATQLDLQASIGSLQADNMEKEKAIQELKLLRDLGFLS